MLEGVGKQNANLPLLIFERGLSLEYNMKKLEEVQGLDFTLRNSDSVTVRGVTHKFDRSGIPLRTQDLIGIKKGGLTIIAYDGAQKGGHHCWKAVCDCGNLTSVRRNHFLGPVENPRCSTECNHRSAAEQIVGQKFNSLTVKELLPVVNQEPRNCIAVCDCGKEVVCDLSKVKQGKKVSCGHGCLVANNWYQFVGQKIERLQILGVTRKRTDGESEEYHFSCLCECGQKCEKPARKVLVSAISSCGCLQREHGRSLVGDKNPNWRNGASSEASLGRNNFRYKAWKAAVHARDGGCQKCGFAGNGKSCLVAHHINNFSSHQGKRYDVDNGTTLCVTCHRKFHSEHGIRNNTAEELQQFISSDWQGPGEMSVPAMYAYIANSSMIESGQRSRKEVLDAILNDEEARNGMEKDFYSEEFSFHRAEAYENEKLADAGDAEDESPETPSLVTAVVSGVSDLT